MFHSGVRGLRPVGVQKPKVLQICGCYNVAFHQYSNVIFAHQCDKKSDFDIFWKTSNQNMVEFNDAGQCRDIGNGRVDDDRHCILLSYGTTCYAVLHQVLMRQARFKV